MNEFENYEEMKASCEKCGNPLYIRKLDGKIVCSVGKVTSEGFIPLSKRCYETVDSVAIGN